MTAFKVEPAALRTYAAQLAQARDQVEKAKSFVDKWGHFNWYQKGLMGLLYPAHGTFVGNLDSLIKHLTDLADASELALSRQAQHYQQTDRSAEARVDAAYPTTARPQVRFD